MAEKNNFVHGIAYGKLYLAGEYAILEDYSKALITSVDKKIIAFVEPNDEITIFDTLNKISVGLYEKNDNFIAIIDFNAFLASKDSFYYKDGITGKYIERKKVNFDNKETEYVTKDTSTIYIRYDVNEGKSSVVIEETGENIREECGLGEESMIKLH